MSLKKMSGNIEIHVIAGEKCQDIWNKPGGPMVLPACFFQGFASVLCFRALLQVFASGSLLQPRNRVDMSGRIW